MPSGISAIGPDCHNSSESELRTRRGNTVRTAPWHKRPVEKSIRGSQAEPARGFDVTRHGAVDRIPNQ